MGGKKEKTNMLQFLHLRALVARPCNRRRPLFGFAIRGDGEKCYLSSVVWLSNKTSEENREV